jgi:hypothetical protein
MACDLLVKKRPRDRRHRRAGAAREIAMRDLVNVVPRS